ncbi:B9 domain-containing protein 2 [Phytophthora boehmeriae]|uniref:B9 domain-containing protein 2 n=1 Tax=Phytophthora boehmeriae TaxID=109152 RepID=A0A8T1WXS1_9STRA|nr:B9 domain-containing protein 2 [Phytophthora boehmeriae]
MLKKLASPRRGTRREGLASLDVDDEQAEAGRTKSSSGKTKEDKAKEKEVAKLKAKEKEVAKAKEKEAAKVKKEEEAKAKKDKAREDKAKEKAKKKKHKSPDAEALAMGEAKAIGEGVRDEAKEAKTPSPRKSFARTFSRRGLFDDKTPEEMSPTKSSPTKKSPRKSLMKLPKPAKKSKSVIKKQETKLHDEDQQAEAAAPTETDPLTSTKADTESPTRKSRWKIDIKHHKSSKSSNNQKKHTHDEEDTPKANKDSPQSKRAHNARHESPRSPRDRAKRTKSKRELSNVESSTGDTSSEHDNQTNVLSPLRRHKPDPEDTLPIPEAPQSAYLLQKRMAQLDVPPAYQPEVHLVGEIVSGQGFGTGWGFCCKWRVEYGSRWSHIAGDQSGQTQVDYPPSPPWVLTLTELVRGQMPPRQLEE